MKSKIKNVLEPDSSLCETNGNLLQAYITCNQPKPKNLTDDGVKPVSKFKIQVKVEWTTKDNQLASNSDQLKPNSVESMNIVK